MGTGSTPKPGAILGRLLHIAAVDGGSMREVVKWSNNLQGQDLANAVQRNRDRLAEGVRSYIDAQKQSRAGETIDSIQQTLSGLLEPLAAPRILDQLSPGPGAEFDIASFLQRPNSLFLIADDDTGLDTGPLVSMFANEVISHAREISQRERGGRLWPAFRAVLDEAPNLAAFPKMDKIVADSGGRGIEVTWFAQAESQLKDRWGENGAATITAASNVKYYLPGLDESTVKPLSDLMGTYERQRSSTTRGRSGSSTSTHTEEKPVMRPEEITQMPAKTAILRYRNLRPMHVSLVPWWERADAEQLQQARVEAYRVCGKVPA